MGGRRAGSLTNLVGSGGNVSIAKRRLTRAVTKEDPNAIAIASAQLIADSNVGLEGIRYGLKLAPYITTNASKLARLTVKDRDEKIRQVWSQIKKRENITTTREVDNVVVVAAKEAFSKGGGKSE